MRLPNTFMIRKSSSEAFRIGLNFEYEQLTKGSNLRPAHSRQDLPQPLRVELRFVNTFLALTLAVLAGVTPPPWPWYR